LQPDREPDPGRGGTAQYFRQPVVAPTPSHAVLALGQPRAHPLPRRARVVVESSDQRVGKDGLDAFRSQTLQNALEVLAARLAQPPDALRRAGRDLLQASSLAV